MRALRWLLVLAAIGIGAGLWLSAPVTLAGDALDGVTGDAERGALVFAAAGCASCHIAPDATEADAPVLSGGRRFASDFGTFVAPNISPDPDHGIGAWTDLELANAIQRGVSREGAHLYPAFPYTTYIHAEVQDVADLIAYLRTLPPSEVASLPHEVGFPFNVRRALGLWKRLYLDPSFVVTEVADDGVARGRYLVESLGHCGECHTPRGPLGGLDRSRWLGGAEHPAQEGRIPNITPAALDWSEADIAEYLSSGFTPEFDSAGGEMAAVVRNMARLSDEDRLAIAAYLKALPPVAEAGTAEDPS